MSTLLHIDSSPLETSISRELAREFVKTWKTAHPTDNVIYRDLAANPPSPLDTAWIHAVFTPADARTPEQKAALAQSDELIAELQKADEYVISAAMHNFTIPSTLKLWIDQVVRVGETFSYGAEGAKGLLKGKKVTILTASGGVYTEGTPAAAVNFTDPYLKTIFGFIGVTDIKAVSAGGASQLMQGTIDRESFLKPNLERVRAAVA
jgi:FMN-dependent NADH-azoreductase